MAECIICRTKAEKFSDEHVIPDSLGGYYHIFSVCKKCNDDLGRTIDDKLVNHKLMEFQRFSLGLSGKTGKVPNPFSGVHTLKDEDGQKVTLEIDKDGKFSPYTLPSVPKIGGLHEGTFNVTLDKKDENDLEKIIQKVCKRNGIPREKLIIKSKESKQNNQVVVDLALDLSKFRIGLLKIAYEFAVDTIPSYYQDDKALIISDILHKAKYEELDKHNLFIGNGLQKDFLKPLERFLDFNENNHYLILFNSDTGLVCFVNLFNILFIGVCLSNKRYDVSGEMIIGVNDIKAKDFTKFKLEELIGRCYSSPELRFAFHFDSEVEAKEFLDLQKDPQFAYYEENKKVPLYNKKGGILYEDCNEKFQQQQLKIYDIEDTNNSIISMIELDEEVYIKINPTGVLVRIVAVRVEQSRLG